MQGKYTESTAKAVIERNGGKVGNKTIKASTPGIKILGAIDYLVKKMGYVWNKN